MECCKLRARVVEVQQQNDELRRLFCDRARNQLNTDDIITIKNLQVDALAYSMTACFNMLKTANPETFQLLYSIVLFWYSYLCFLTWPLVSTDLVALVPMM